MNRVFIIFLFLCTSCYEKLDIRVDNQEYLVVDAWVTDELINHQIKIEKLSSVGEPVAVLDAIVYLENELGEKIKFLWSNTVKSYDYYGKINVDLPLRLSIIIGSKKYQSNWQLPSTSALIENLDIENSIQKIITYTGEMEDVDFLKFSIKLIPNGKKTYLFFKKKGVYEYHSLPVGEGYVRICWFNDIDNNYFHVTSLKSKNPLYIPLFTTQSNSKFLRYNLIVQQYAINEQSYRYWSAIEEVRSSSGGLFDAPPVEIKGNVYNINNLEETVLGHFTMAKYYTKRFVISEDNLPVILPTNSCQSLYEDLMRGVTNVEIEDYCYDCTLNGGDSTEFEGWIEP